MIQKNYSLIERCIQSCKTHEQLMTCERMIKERISNWELAYRLVDLVQIQIVEIIVSRYPVMED